MRVRPPPDLQSAFPEQFEAVVRLRAVDSTFDEICRDFEEIAGIIQAEFAGEEQTEKMSSDLEETLRGLHGEITAKLAEKADTQE